MTTNEILETIDAEIAMLKEARAILAGTQTADGRSPLAGEAPRKRRAMSPEARAKIAAAQRKRWAKQRKGKV
jgi:hypothetical protein